MQWVRPSLSLRLSSVREFFGVSLLLLPLCVSVFSLTERVLPDPLFLTVAPLPLGARSRPTRSRRYAFPSYYYCCVGALRGCVVAGASRQFLCCIAQQIPSVVCFAVYVRYLSYFFHRFADLCSLCFLSASYRRSASSPRRV